MDVVLIKITTKPMSYDPVLAQLDEHLREMDRQELAAEHEESERLEAVQDELLELAKYLPLAEGHALHVAIDDHWHDIERLEELLESAKGVEV